MSETQTQTIKQQLDELSEKIADSCEAGLNDKAMARVKEQLTSAMEEAQSDFEYWLRSDGSLNLSGFVVRMAGDAIEAMLKGDDAEMRRRLHCVEGLFTGRDRDHPVIHGKLFEAAAIVLRKRIVDAHPQLLKDQRILDLEDQVKSLVLQARKAEVEKEQLQHRLGSLGL